MGVLLFIIALVLSVLTLPFGMVYTVLKCLFSFRFKHLWKLTNHYFLKLAVSIDQLGNVAMQELFNDLLIKDKTYPFGHEDETISSVIGKNLKYCKLTKVGHFLNAILDFLDPNHSLNSIEQLEKKLENTENGNAV